jgi:hypothetical protein
MDERSKSVAKRCLQDAEEDSMTFPEIVGRLRDAGFEGYAIDFRRAHATYYMPDGESVDLPMHEIRAAIAPVFEAGRVQAAIKEAQQLAPGYTLQQGRDGRLCGVYRLVFGPPGAIFRANGGNACGAFSRLGQ